MKMDFKRFLSSFMAFIMAFSAMTIGNVSSISASTDDTTDLYVVNDATSIPSWFSAGDGAKTQFTRALTFTDTIFSDDTGTAKNKNEYQYAIGGSFSVAVAGNATLKVYTALNNSGTGTITAAKSIGNGSITPTVAQDIPGRDDTGVAALEYTITAADGDTTASTYSFTYGGKKDCALFAVELTYDSELNSGGGGGEDTSHQFQVNVTTSKDLQGDIIIYNVDSGEQVTANTMTVTQDSSATFKVNYHGPDYTMEEQSTGTYIQGDSSLTSNDFNIDEFLTPVNYTITFTVDDGITPTGTLKLGENTATLADGKFTFTDVPYASKYDVTYEGTDYTLSTNDQSLTITYNPANAPSYADIAYPTLTFTSNDTPVEPTVEDISGALASAVDSDITLTLTGASGTAYTATVTAGDTAFTFSDVSTDDLNQPATLAVSGDYEVSPTTIDSLTGDSLASVTVTSKTPVEPDPSGLTAVDTTGTVTYAFGSSGNATTTNFEFGSAANNSAKASQIDLSTSYDTSYVKFVLAEDSKLDITLSNKAAEISPDAYSDEGLSTTVSQIATGTSTVYLKAGTYTIKRSSSASGTGASYLNSLKFTALNSTPVTKVTISGNLTAAADKDIYLVLTTADGTAHNTTVPAGETAFAFTDVTEAELGKSATLAAEGYTLDPTSVDSLATDSFATVTATAGGSGEDPDPSTDKVMTDVIDFSGITAVTSGTTAFANNNKLYIYGGNSNTKTDTGSSYTGTYNLPDGYVYDNNTTSYQSAAAFRFGGTSATTTGGLKAVLVVNLADDNSDLIVGYYAGSNRTVEVAPFDTATQTIDTTNAQVIPNTTNSKEIGVATGLKAGTYAIYAPNGDVRIGLLGTTSTFATVDMTATDPVEKTQYAYRVDATGISPVPTGNFYFKSGSTTLDASGTVDEGTEINVYYDGTDYRFSGGYITMIAGTASTGVTIDDSTSPETMVLNLSSIVAFKEALKETHVYRTNLENTPNEDGSITWQYLFQSGNYTEGYLPLSATVADSGVINASGSTIENGPNGIYDNEAYGGIDTKDTDAGSGENQVVATPGYGAELQDTNGLGSGKAGLITTLYMPLPETYSTGKLTVSGSVYTTDATGQWTMMQIGDVGGFRTTQNSVTPTRYGLRLGNGSASNSPYSDTDLAEDGVDTSKLYNVTTENTSTISASAGWMDYTLVVDFTAQTITLNIGSDVITASLAAVPSNFRKVGYIKTMTETGGQRNLTVGDTTIIYEPPKVSTTSKVILNATNKTDKAYDVIIYDADGEVVDTISSSVISAKTTDNTDAETIVLGELPAGDYTIDYLYNGTDATSVVDITTFAFTVSQDDIDAGRDVTVDTTITEKTKSTVSFNVNIINNATNEEDGTYPLSLYISDANNNGILLSPELDPTLNASYMQYEISQHNDSEVWNITDVDLPAGMYYFIIRSEHGLKSETTIPAEVKDDGTTVNGEVVITNLETSDLEPVPWNSSDSDWYVFGTSKNVQDGVYTDSDGNTHKYFGYDTATFTTDATHLFFPREGDNSFVFTPENDSKLVIKVNEGLSFAPGVYSTTDLTGAPDVSGISSTGTYTYYVKGGTTYTILGLTSKTTRIQQLQLRPFTEVATVKVSVDAINKTDKDTVVSVYDGTTFMESFTASAYTETAVNHALTKSYVPGKSYTFRSSDNSVKIESYEFSIPADQTTDYTAKVTLGSQQGLKIYLRNAPASGFNMTFNGTTDTYDSTTYIHTYDVVAGQSYVFSTANDSNIIKWPAEKLFTYDKTANKYYIHVPEDYNGDYILYFDYATNTLHTLYEKDNSTSVADAHVGYGQYGFGEVKTTVTGTDARTTLTYAGVTPSLTDFKASYEYAVRGDLNLGYVYDNDDASLGESMGYRYTVSKETSKVENDNRLLINADTDSYVQFTSDVDGICKVDRSMKKIVVEEDGTSIATTTSTNGNYQFFNVKEGSTYKIMGDTKTSNTHIKSIRIFPKDNLFHYENIQNVGAYSDDATANEVLNTNGNVAVTAEAGVNAGDIMYRLFGYFEQDAVGDADVFDSVDYVGWTLVKKSDVDTYEGFGRGSYNPNMTKLETQYTESDFEGISQTDNKNLDGRNLYVQAYDYSIAPGADGYKYLTGYGANGPLLLRHIAASAGTEYYAYPYTVYKGSSVKSYTAESDSTATVPWRITVTF